MYWIDGWWWLMMVDDGWWWLMMVDDDWWWSVLGVFCWYSFVCTYLRLNLCVLRERFTTKTKTKTKTKNKKQAKPANNWFDLDLVWIWFGFELDLNWIDNKKNEVVCGCDCFVPSCDRQLFWSCVGLVHPTIHFSNASSRFTACTSLAKRLRIAVVVMVVIGGIRFQTKFNRLAELMADNSPYQVTLHIALKQVCNFPTLTQMQQKQSSIDNAIHRNLFQCYLL